MRSPLAAGTADFVSSDFPINHGVHDLLTFYLGQALGRVGDYYSVRPTIIEP